jgi:thiamine biosynthesis protein ThiS
MTIEIVMNGEKVDIPKGQSLHDLFNSLNICGQSVFISVNLKLALRRQWRQVILQPNDRVDIVRAIAAG